MEEPNYQVIYRKYRPQNFSEIVGQEHIVQTLTNALYSNRVAHAYLFTGPRGTGKTTIARLLAKAVNCLNRGEKSEPCNKCDVCQEINDGRALDLIEIDAASNRGIDEMRELRDGIKFNPVRLKYKFFIIDECHMLTPPAFNALLKTLEEPPSYAIFVLATTESHKVPETIISRCQKFDFHKLNFNQIIERLKQIAKKEKVDIERDALQIVASNAEGAMRDAESLFGQIMAIGAMAEDGKITSEEVKTFLGVTDNSALVDMVNCLANKDAGAAINFLNKIIEGGYDIEQFAKSLINYLRKIMIMKVDISLAKIVAPEFTEEQTRVVINQIEKFSESDLLKIIRLLISASNEMKFSSFAQLPLELAIVEFICKNE